MKLIYLGASLLLATWLWAADIVIGDKEALIIIDMQPFFVERGGNHKDPENVKKVKSIISSQIELIEMAKIKKIPIIFLEYDDFGETTSDLKVAASSHPDVAYILKNTDGVFENSNRFRDELINHLSKREIGALIITGANGGACVERSIQGALENNYTVVAVNTAIADFNYEKFIYPYSKQYNFKPTCKDCEFAEADGLESVTVNLINYKNRRANSNSMINDRARGTIKERDASSSLPVDQNSTTGR